MFDEGDWNILGQSTKAKPNLIPGGTNPASGWNWTSSIDTKTGLKTTGMLDYGIGALSGLGNLFMGMQNYGLAKDQLKFQKDAYNKNYAAQKQTANASLEDRQRARVASNPNAYVSVSDYMTKNGIA